MSSTPLRLASALFAGLVFLGCSGSTGTPVEPNAPASAALDIDGTLGDDNYLLVAGTTVPVDVRFYDDQGIEITGIEDTHFATITFTPSTLATVADVPGEHFHKTVTAGAQLGSGTVTIGYGRDSAANELSFGPFAVTVVAAGTKQ